MPSLGADMEEGTVAEWRVAPGDRVTKGDIVALVETDKAVIDVEVFETGVVEELLVEVGARVPVGTVLAHIGTGAEPVAEPSAPAPVPTTAKAEAEAEVAPLVPTGGKGRHHASVVLSPLVRHLADELDVQTTRLPGSGPGGRITREDVERAGRHRHRATPRARRLAGAAGVDTASLTGTGPGGAVVGRDVPAAAGAAAAATPEDRAAEAAATRRRATRSSIARTMLRSWTEIPHFRLTSVIDVEPTLEWLAEHNAELPPAQRIVPAAALLRATAVAAARVPGLNGWWIDGELRRSPTVDVGTVVSLREGGLVTPTVRGADQLGVDEVMEVLRGLVDRARRGGLRSSDMAEASLTVTNLGDRGADEVHGIIHPPQVALVGFGRVIPRPWAHGDQVVVRRCVATTLAADHRAVDGHPGSRFLHALETALAAPERSMGGPT